MDLLYNLLKSNINIVDVETTADPKELLASKVASIMMFYKEEGKPIRELTIDYKSNSYHINDTIYAFEPLPDEAILREEIRVLLMGVLAEVVFSGKLSKEKIDEELHSFYDRNKFDFENFSDCKLYLYLQLKPCLAIFKNYTDEVLDYSKMLLEKGTLTYEDDLLEEFENPHTYGNY